MLNEWSDRMSTSKMSEFWQRQFEEELQRRVALVEADLRRTFERRQELPLGFYDAMQHFLRLRQSVFPDFPVDPAWKILVILAQTPEGSDKASVSGISHGAEVPLTTALRYIAAMEAQGIIERVPHPNDKRQTMLRLTGEGRRRMEMLEDKWMMRLIAACAIPLTLLACISAKLMS